MRPPQATAPVESGRDVPYRDLADWCVKVLREVAERERRQRAAARTDERRAG